MSETTSGTRSLRSPRRESFARDTEEQFHILSIGVPSHRMNICVWQYWNPFSVALANKCIHMPTKHSSTIKLQYEVTFVSYTTSIC